MPGNGFGERERTSPTSLIPVSDLTRTHTCDAITPPRHHHPQPKVIQRYQRVLDEASGKYYFIDMATKVSSWKRPPMINKAMEEYILTPRRFRAMRQEANEKLPSLTRQKARKKKAKGRAKY